MMEELLMYKKQNKTLGETSHAGDRIVQYRGRFKRFFVKTKCSARFAIAPPPIFSLFPNFINSITYRTVAAKSTIDNLEVFL